jgi:hypothetical protein
MFARKRLLPTSGSSRSRDMAFNRDRRAAAVTPGFYLAHISCCPAGHAIDEADHNGRALCSPLPADGQMVQCEKCWTSGAKAVSVQLRPACQTVGRAEPDGTAK